MRGMSKNPTPVPPWSVRALLKVFRTKITDFDPMKVVWNPCANVGFMSATLSEAFPVVISTDAGKFDYGHGQLDFFNDPFPMDRKPDWLIFAPQAKRLKKGEIGSIDDYVSRALDVAQHGVAIFAKTDFLHGVQRHERIFNANVPIIYAPFVEAIGLSEINSPDKKVHKRNYAWFIWLKGVRQATRLFPIAPCQDELTREYDNEINKLMPVFRLRK